MSYLIKHIQANGRDTVLAEKTIVDIDKNQLKIIDLNTAGHGYFENMIL